MKLKYFIDVKNALSFVYSQFVADMERRNQLPQYEGQEYKGEEMLEDIKSMRDLILQADVTKSKCDEIEQRLVQYHKLHELLKESYDKVHNLESSLAVAGQFGHIEKLYGV